MRIERQRVSGDTKDTIRNTNIHIKEGPKGKGGEKGAEKISEKLWPKLLKLDFKKLIFNKLKVQRNPSKINIMRPIPLWQHSQNVESQTQRENLECIKRKLSHHIKGNQNKINSWFHVRNYGNQTAVTWHVQSALKKTLVNQESYILQNCMSNMK